MTGCEDAVELGVIFKRRCAEPIHGVNAYKQIADADHGAKVGVKVTLENHWGLTANPINIRIIVDEVKSPFCEASPDF